MKTTYEKIINYLWLGLVAFLPLSSFPLVAKLLHTSSVAPASLIFLGLLLIMWLPVYLKKDGRFPFQINIVFVFLLFALISTLLSYFYFVPAYKENTLTLAVFEGIATMVIGFFFYLVTVIMPNSEVKIQRTLKVINWSGAVMILWAVVSLAVIILAPKSIRHLVREVQTLVSVTTVHVDRAVGFASEPSWLAHILNMVYLPYWLGAALTRFTAHKKKIWKLTFENLLLVGGVITLAVTSSRAGYLAFFLTIGFLFIKFNIWLLKKVSQKWSSSRVKALLNALMVLGVVLIYLGLVFGAVFALSKLDPRMADVFSVETLKQGGLVKYSDTLQFGERVTYWATGWRIFNSHPIFGVGLGNAGFYFQKLLPDSAWQLSEVRRFLYNSPGLINVKSLWMRILAETGIVGFSLFLVFLVATVATASQLTKSNSAMKKSIGWMGIMMAVALIMEGFSVDSYALPYIWFTTGLVAATWRWTKSEATE